MKNSVEHNVVLNVMERFHTVSSQYLLGEGLKKTNDCFADHRQASLLAGLLHMLSMMLRDGLSPRLETRIVYQLRALLNEPKLSPALKRAIEQFFETCTQRHHCAC